MNKDILLWSNIEIMFVLDKWGVLTLKNLKSLLGFDISLHGLRRKIHRLAQDEYVQISRTNVKNEIIVLPTKKTLNYLKSNRSSIDDTMIYHNLFISILGTELLTRNNVIYCRLPHEYQSSRSPSSFKLNNEIGENLSPDAYLGIKHESTIFKVAIEVELTQKSSDRIYEKFNNYVESNYFDYVVYFFKNKAIFNSYKRRLNDLLIEAKNDTIIKNFKERILFLYSDQNYQQGLILNNSILECQSKELDINKFFGPATNFNNL